MRNAPQGMPSDAAGNASVTLTPRAERRLIRPTGSKRHVDFHIQIGQLPVAPGTRPERTPLTLGVVLDRSGSMSGEKLATAKRATLALLDRLDERDRFALVVYDDQIDEIQRADAVTSALRERVTAALNRIEARASTALHAGWLTGCRAIAGDVTPGQDRLVRCFLLTDGLANVGETDPERIASDATGIRTTTGIGTSTFGIGNDYDERLLGPMAVAGGGQFHHLRSAEEITSTFVGELGGLLAVAAQQVRLELDLGTNVLADVISAYWSAPGSEPGRISISIGDLIGGEERHVVVRFRFPEQAGAAGHAVRARLVWLSKGVEQRTDWQELSFGYAANDVCTAEARDPAVTHWVGLHHADRAERAATDLNRQGDFAGAQALLNSVARRIEGYAGNDADLHAAIEELRGVGEAVASAPMAVAERQELYYQSQRRSRQQHDYRSPRR